MTAEFTLEPVGLLALLNDTEARGFVEQLAQKGAEETRRLTPPRLAKTIGSTPAETTSEGAKATFYNDSSFWHLVEFGSINNSPLRPLTRAAQSIGTRFEEL